jgi:hypothetical protein
MSKNIFLRTHKIEAIIRHIAHYISSEVSYGVKVGDILTIHEYNFNVDDCLGRRFNVSVLEIIRIPVPGYTNRFIEVVLISEPLGLSGVQN